MGALDSYATYAEQVGARMSSQPQQLKITRRLGASQGELFEYVTDFSRLSEWIPGCRKSWSDDTHAEAPGQVGAVRMISSGLGKPVREVVRAYEAPRMLAYSATDDSLFGLMTDHLGVLTCEPHAGGGAVFCWLAYGRPAKSAAVRWVGDKVFRIALHGGTKKLEQRFPAG